MRPNPTPMLVPTSRTRAGISLTEILISILIMGVGLVSVASLFPIGLKRIEEATNNSRSTLTTESAFSDVQTRNLFEAQTFTNSWYGLRSTIDSGPFVWDYWGATGTEAQAATVNAPGLPFAYDPLFWSELHYITASDATPATPSTMNALYGSPLAGRFGSGLGFVRPDPQGGGMPSAYGLQRLTNFLPYGGATTPPIYSFTYSTPALPGVGEVAGDIFTSLDDPVLQEESVQSDPVNGLGSPLVPADFVPDDPAIPTTLGVQGQRDYKYSWMVTARQVAAGDSTVFEGDVVVFHNRPIGLETRPASFGYHLGNVPVPSGERVVEAVWGHTNSVPAGAGTTFYSTGDERLVLLRWPAGSADPSVPVGSWIADVTYEGVEAVASSPTLPGRFIYSYPGQRIHWYRVVQRGTAEPDPAIADHRRMTVRVDRPVKAKTLLTVNGGNVVPYHVEAALINNYIVNVFPQIFYAR